MNSSYLYPRGDISHRIILEKDKEYTMVNGDVVTLLPNTYEFKLVNNEDSNGMSLSV